MGFLSAFADIGFIKTPDHCTKAESGNGKGEFSSSSDLVTRLNQVTGNVKSDLTHSNKAESGKGEGEF
jgi:hypothetical protein